MSSTVTRKRPAICTSVDPGVAEFVSFAVENGLSKTRSEFVENAIRAYAWGLYVFIRFSEKYLEKIKNMENPPDDIVYTTYLEVMKELSSEKIEVAQAFNPKIFAQIADKILSMDPRTREELKEWVNKLMKTA